MKRILCTILVVIFLLPIFTSCGVMFGGSKYMAMIEVKNHPDAEIYVDGNKIGTGSGSGLFERNRPLTIEVKETGCEPKTKTFYKTFRTGNFILSLAVWGLIGIAIDLGTGASFKPNHRKIPEVQKMSDRNFKFDIDYENCNAN